MFGGVFYDAFLGGVAVCTAKAAYSCQTFPVIICTVCLCIGVSVQCIVENGGLDPDAVWDVGRTGPWTVSYTHLTLPTNREV